MLAGVSISNGDDRRERRRLASQVYRERHREKVRASGRTYHREHQEQYTQAARERRATMFMPLGHPLNCKAPGCPRRLMTNGFCDRHDMQRRRGEYTGRSPEGWWGERPWLIMGQPIPRREDGQASLFRSKDDPVIDEVAIHLAINGVRRVRLTTTERKVAVRLMAERNMWVSEMKERLVASAHFVCSALEEAGYEVLRDTSGSGHSSVVRKDRKKGAPMTDQTSSLGRVIPSLAKPHWDRTA